MRAGMAILSGRLPECTGEALLLYRDVEHSTVDLLSALYTFSPHSSRIEPCSIDRRLEQHKHCNYGKRTMSNSKVKPRNPA